MLVFVVGGILSYVGGSGERTQVTLVGKSAIPPFLLPLCDYNLENFSNSRVNMNGWIKTTPSILIRCAGVFRLFRCSGVFRGVPVFQILIHAVTN